MVNKKIRFHIFDDCVYAYEYTLAHYELLSFIDKKDISSGLFDGYTDVNSNNKDIQLFIKKLAYFDSLKFNGSLHHTHQYFLSKVNGAIATNSGKGYMTHWIYPYKGKFHPQMIRALINIMGIKEGQKLLDPMTGSGTVNVEASLMGIDSVGVDCLPIAVLITKVKTGLLKKIFQGNSLIPFRTSLQPILRIALIIL